jgi:flagellar biosynthesis/type III secretory pathway M-ring protein FliF/YscJ
MNLWFLILIAAALSALSASVLLVWTRRHVRRAIAAARQDLIDQTNRALKRFADRQDGRFAPLEQHRQDDEARETDRRQRADAVKATIENMKRHDPRGAFNVLQD